MWVRVVIGSAIVVAMVALPVLALYNLIMLAVKREKAYFHRFLVYFVIAVVGYGYAILSPGWMTNRGMGQSTGCKSNLKNIGTALEMYSTDFKGNYPTSMAALTPNYLRVIPACPAAGTDTYSATYQTAGQPPGPDGPPVEVADAYTFYCSGHHHENAHFNANYPQYSSHQGLIESSDQVLIER